MKSAHVSIRAGEEFIREDDAGETLYTLYEGWACRFKRCADGGRQILDILLPGDLVGLQSPLTGSIRHSVSALTDISLCLLGGRPLQHLFRHHSALAQAMMRSLAEDEERSDERLVMLGCLRPLARVSYFFLDTFDRLEARRMALSARSCPFPLSYAQLCDALGLSRAHLARTLSRLRELDWATVSAGMLQIGNREKLEVLCEYQPRREGGHRAIL